MYIYIYIYICIYIATNLSTANSSQLEYSTLQVVQKVSLLNNIVK